LLKTSSDSGSEFNINNERELIDDFIVEMGKTKLRKNQVESEKKVLSK